MRHSSHHEPGGEVAEAVEVLEDERRAAHQDGVLEVLGQSRDELGHEQRVVVVEASDERHVEHGVVQRGMAAGTRAAVTREGLVDEELRSLANQGVEDDVGVHEDGQLGVGAAHRQKRRVRGWPPLDALGEVAGQKPRLAAQGCVQTLKQRE